MIIEIIMTNFKYLFSLLTIKGDIKNDIKKYLGIDENVPVSVGTIKQKNAKNQ